MSISTREITPVERIDANLKVPGSRGQMEQALICSVLAEGTSQIHPPFRSDQTLTLARALGALGYNIGWEEDVVRVEGRGGAIPTAEVKIDAGNASRAMRLLTALLSLGWSRYEIDAGEEVRGHPVRDLIDPLGFLGGGATATGEDGCPPVVVEGAGLRGGKTVHPGGQRTASLSALLLVAPYAENAVEIEVEEEFVLRHDIDLTLHVMSEFGVLVEQDAYRTFRVPAGRRYRGRDLVIDGDATTASYFFAAAAVTGGRVRVTNLDSQSHQGDVGFVDILGRMGCKVETGDGWIEVSGGELQGVTADLSCMPALTPALAVTSLFARGKTTLRNVVPDDAGEDDQVTGLVRELRRVGAGVRFRGPDLEIQPKRFKRAEIETYGDDHMAMSFALFGLKVAGIRIRNPDVVTRSFPDFFDHLEKLGQ